MIKIEAMLMENIAYQVKLIWKKHLRR